MRRFFLFALSVFFLLSCTDRASGDIPIPGKPTSADAMNQLVKRKIYETKKVATISPFEMDKENPYEWMDARKDTSNFSRNYLQERLRFSIEFVNDTSVVMNDDNKKITGTYKFDSDTGDGEKEGIKLRVSYADNTMSFPGASGPMIMTYTYFVSGADEKSLLLETPRSYNNRRVAVLMQRPGKPD